MLNYSNEEEDLDKALENFNLQQHDATLFHLKEQKIQIRMKQIFAQRMI